MKAVVRWKPGSRVKADVEVAHQLIEKNISQYGGFNPEALWRSQKNKSAPLHDVFEWDKNKAWVMLNNTRSNYIVRSIETVATDPMNAEHEMVVRTYEVSGESLPDKRGKKIVAYRNTLDMLADPEGREFLLQRAIQDVQNFKRKYAALSELSRIIGSMDDFLDDTGT